MQGLPRKGHRTYPTLETMMDFTRKLPIGVIILVISLVIVYLVARAIVKPIHAAVSALQNIAQGEGDLTVRLPVHGNDEITDMASGAVQINNAVQEGNELTQKNKRSIQNLAEEVGKFIEINAQCIRSGKGG